MTSLLIIPSVLKDSCARQLTDTAVIFWMVFMCAVPSISSTGYPLNETVCVNLWYRALRYCPVS